MLKAVLRLCSRHCYATNSIIVLFILFCAMFLRQKLFSFSFGDSGSLCVLLPVSCSISVIPLLLNYFYSQDLVLNISLFIFSEVLQSDNDYLV